MPLFASPDIARTDLPDGTIRLSSREPLGAYPPMLAHWLRAGAQAHPERVLLTRGDASVTWGAARATADAVGAGLLAAGCGPDRPVLVLSGNSLEHALLTFAAYTVGVPI